MGREIERGALIPTQDLREHELEMQLQSPQASSKQPTAEITSRDIGVTRKVLDYILRRTDVSAIGAIGMGEIMPALQGEQAILHQREENARKQQEIERGRRDSRHMARRAFLLESGKAIALGVPATALSGGLAGVLWKNRIEARGEAFDQMQNARAELQEMPDEFAATTSVTDQEQVIKEARPAAEQYAKARQRLNDLDGEGSPLEGLKSLAMLPIIAAPFIIAYATGDSIKDSTMKYKTSRKT